MGNNDNNFNIFEILGLQSPDADDHIRDPIGRLSPTFDPLSALPDPLHSEIPSSPPPSSSPANTLSPALTEEDAENVEILLKVLSPEFIDSLVEMAETPPDLVPEPPTPPSIPTASCESLSPVSSALFSPVTAYAAPSASPPTLKRPFSLMDPPDESQEPVPGPSAPRPTKRPCTTTTTTAAATFPGEFTFRLDPNIAPLVLSQPTGQQMGKPRKPRGDYSACKCEGGLTSKPARHWRVCPYNPEAGAQPFACEYCDKLFGREDNKKRHIKEYHPEIDI